MLEPGEMWAIRIGGGDRNKNGKPDVSVKCALGFDGIPEKSVDSGPMDIPVDRMIAGGFLLVDGLIDALPMLPPPVKQFMHGALGFVNGVLAARDLIGKMDVRNHVAAVLGGDKPAGF